MPVSLMSTSPIPLAQRGAAGLDALARRPDYARCGIACGMMVVTIEASSAS